MLRNLKWLYPGLRIKRWVAVMLVGVILASAGSAALLFGLLSSELAVQKRAFTFAWIGFILGSFALFVGFYRLMKSIGQLLTRSDKSLVDIAYERRYLSHKPKVVALGGGTGMSVLLTGLKNYTAELTAVVSVADDGGSSGKLRAEFGMVAPGDIRKCLIALSDEAPMLGRLLSYRFGEEELEGHCFGNLFLTVLTRVTGDFGEAVRQANRILGVRGRVIPATLDRIHLVAEHPDGTKTTGQRLISDTEKRIEKVSLKPSAGKVAEDIVQAIRLADMIVLGPGSLYTSIIPNLLIEGAADAIRRSSAQKVYVCNVMTNEGETAGYSVHDHIKAIESHAGGKLFDWVLVNSGHVTPGAMRSIHGGTEAKPVLLDVREFDGEGDGYRFVAEDVISRENPLKHNPERLARALMSLFQQNAASKVQS